MRMTEKEISNSSRRIYSNSSMMKNRMDDNFFLKKVLNVNPLFEEQLMEVLKEIIIDNKEIEKIDDLMPILKKYDEGFKNALLRKSLNEIAAAMSDMKNKNYYLLVISIFSKSMMDSELPLDILNEMKESVDEDFIKELQLEEYFKEIIQTLTAGEGIQENRTYSGDEIYTIINNPMAQQFIKNAAIHHKFSEKILENRKPKVEPLTNKNVKDILDALDSKTIDLQQTRIDFQNLFQQLELDIINRFNAINRDFGLIYNTEGFNPDLLKGNTPEEAKQADEVRFLVKNILRDTAQGNTLPFNPPDIKSGQYDNNIVTIVKQENIYQVINKFKCGIENDTKNYKTKLMTAITAFHFFNNTYCSGVLNFRAATIEEKEHFKTILNDFASFDFIQGQMEGKLGKDGLSVLSEILFNSDGTSKINEAKDVEKYCRITKHFIDSYGMQDNLKQKQPQPIAFEDLFRDIDVAASMPPKTSQPTSIAELLAELDKHVTNDSYH